MDIPFTILIIAGWLAILVLMGRGVVVRKWNETLPIAAFRIGVLAAMHPQVGFLLQIPGFRSRDALLSTWDWLTLCAAMIGFNLTNH